ncbi:MAG: ATP synthase F1 subunit epsilon [Myxococcales bacterium]|nr:ATP synthase F1 subunit epsilon [Myxococcales bacterium]MCB9708900.1 ATP synthase F1 subunit epsilon [Myxococcales bacterium]
MAELAEALHLEVATPLGRALSVEVRSVQAPSVSGEFGVLSGHLPLLASLKSGILHYVIDGREHRAAIGPGYAEVSPETMRILTDQFATPSQIDVKAVRQELATTEATLRGLSKDQEADPEKLEQLDRAIAWCHARLDVAQERV